MGVKGAQAREPSAACRYPPPPRISDVLSPRYPPHARRVFPQGLGALQEKKVVSTPQAQKRTIENWSPESTFEKMHIDNPQPTDSGLPQEDNPRMVSEKEVNESASHQGSEEEAERRPTSPQSPENNKRQKTERQATPTQSPGGMASPGEDCDANHQTKSNGDSKMIDLTTTANTQHIDSHGPNEEMTVARVLTSLNDGEKAAEFAVAYI